MRPFLSILLVLSVSPSYGSTFDVVLKSKKCEIGRNQQTTCEFRLGNSLHFAIAGVGQSDASIVFMKSDFEGDYYASFALSHQCVIVFPKGVLDLAFVSPRTGKVYRTWPECRGE